MNTIRNDEMGRDHVAVLSDERLMFRLDLLAYKERKASLDIVLHLAEMDGRRAYLGYGYFSLFDYCTNRLGYSESSANRRIRAARCIKRFPEVYWLLCDQKLTITVVSMIASLLTDSNKDELLESVCGKSQREVETIVATYRQGRPTYDRIIPMGVTPNAGRCQKTYRHHGGDGVDDGVGAGEQGTRSAEQRFKVEFGAGETFMEKLEEVRGLVADGVGRPPGLEEVFTTLMEEYIERHSPQRRKARRDKRQKRAAAVAAGGCRSATAVAAGGCRSATAVAAGGRKRAAADRETARSAFAQNDRHR